MKIQWLSLMTLIHVCMLVRGENNLISTIIEKLMECVTQAPENFSMETCQEMIHPKNDNTQAKYDDCKCVAACTGKKLGLIDDKGNAVPEKLKYYAENIEADSMWKKEAETVIEKCNNTPGKGCELAFNWIQCALTNSEKSLDFIKVFVSGGESGIPKSN